MDKLKLLRSEEPTTAKKEVFESAKESMQMQVNETIKLLRNTDYDCRLGAVLILDWKAEARKLLKKRKKRYAIRI